MTTFLGAAAGPVDAEALAARGVRAAFLGAPVDGQVVPSRPGVANGPHAAREASRQYAGYPTLEDEVDVRAWWRMADCGDVDVGFADLRGAHRAIAAAAGTLLDGGVLPLLMGGDHSVPIPGARALAEHVDGAVGYLQIDAHLDTADAIDGERMTMASPVARVVELPDVAARNVAVVGARGLANSVEEIENARRLGVHVFGMADVIARGVDAVIEDALDVVWDGVRTVYVSFDNDAVDASAAPGTTAPEPAGLTAREVMRMASAIGRRGFGMLDVVELSPAYDPSGITARLDCYWVVYLLAAYARALESGRAAPPPFAAWAP